MLSPVPGSEHILNKRLVVLLLTVSHMEKLGISPTPRSLWPIISQTDRKSIGETQLCKRTHSCVLEKRDLWFKNIFSAWVLCLLLAVIWQCLLCLPDGWSLWSVNGHPEISWHQLPSPDPKFQRLPGSGKRRSMLVEAPEMRLLALVPVLFRRSQSPSQDVSLKVLPPEVMSTVRQTPGGPGPATPSSLILTSCSTSPSLTFHL